METYKSLIKTNTSASNQEVIELLTSLSGNEICQILDINGENLLHWTAAFDNIQVLEFLLFKKLLHVNMENFRGTTALYYASMSNSISAVKILLKFGANPRIRSGFSGQFPYEITTNDEIKKMLLDADKLIPLDYDLALKLKSGFSVYQSYSYRLYMYWLSNLNYFNNKHKHTIQGIDIIEEAKKMTIKELSDKCDELLDGYLVSNIKITNDYCMLCHKDNKDKNLLRCSRCKEALFCDTKCQKSAFKIHKLDCQIY